MHSRVVSTVMCLVIKLEPKSMSSPDQYNWEHWHAVIGCVHTEECTSCNWCGFGTPVVRETEVDDNTPVDDYDRAMGAI